MLQERVEQLEASSAAASSAAESARASAAQERLALHAAAAAQEAALRELKVQLDDQKQEVKHVRLEAASMSKRYEQALQRLRREADAGERTGQQQCRLYICLLVGSCMLYDIAVSCWPTGCLHQQ